MSKHRPQIKKTEALIFFLLFYFNTGVFLTICLCGHIHTPLCRFSRWCVHTGGADELRQFKSQSESPTAPDPSLPFKHSSHWNLRFHKKFFSSAQQQGQRQWKTRGSLWTWGTQRLQSVHPWGYPKVTWTWIRATDSRCPCWSMGVGLHHLKNPLPTSSTQWFCDQTPRKGWDIACHLASQQRKKKLPLKNLALEQTPFALSFGLLYPLLNNWSLPCPQIPSPLPLPTHHYPVS